MNIQNAIRKGKMILSEKKIKTAELDSEILMSKAINKEKKFLIFLMIWSISVQKVNQ